MFAGPLSLRPPIPPPLVGRSIAILAQLAEFFWGEFYLLLIFALAPLWKWSLFICIFQLFNHFLRSKKLCEVCKHSFWGILGKLHIFILLAPNMFGCLSGASRPSRMGQGFPASWNFTVLLNYPPKGSTKWQKWLQYYASTDLLPFVSNTRFYSRLSASMDFQNFLLRPAMDRGLY